MCLLTSLGLFPDPLFFSSAKNSPKVQEELSTFPLNCFLFIVLMSNSSRFLTHSLTSNEEENIDCIS